MCECFNGRRIQLEDRPTLLLCEVREKIVRQQ